MQDLCVRFLRHNLALMIILEYRKTNLAPYFFRPKTSNVNVAPLIVQLTLYMFYVENLFLVKK